MNLGWRSLTAVSILAGLASPGILTLGVAAHLVLDDHHRIPAGHHHAATFEFAIHGHRHDADTADHGHPLIVTVRPAPPSPKKAPEAAAASAPARVFGATSLTRGGLGPQPVPEESPPSLPQVPITLRI